MSGAVGGSWRGWRAGGPPWPPRRTACGESSGHSASSPRAPRQGRERRGHMPLGLGSLPGLLGIPQGLSWQGKDSTFLTSCPPGPPVPWAGFRNEPVRVQKDTVVSPPSRGPGDRVEFTVPLLPFYSNRTKHNLKHTLEGGVPRPPPRQRHLLPLPRAQQTQGCLGGGSPRGREEGPIDGAKAGQAHEDGDDPGHDAQVIGSEVLQRQ